MPQCFKCFSKFINYDLLFLEYASKLENIFFIYLFNSLDKKQVGNQNLFKHLISEINFFRRVWY